MGSSADSEPAPSHGWRQAEITDDQSIANKQGKQLATLLEANWLIARGNNLKITDEFLNPNRAVPNGEQSALELGV